MGHIKWSKFSKRSIDNLVTCDLKLQLLFTQVVNHFDCSIICGHRDKDEQNKAFMSGASRLSWPNSAHNKMPSLAVDVWPYPAPRINGEIDNNSIIWKNFMYFVMGVAAGLKIPLICGGMWKNFPDYAHYEMVIKK